MAKRTQDNQTGHESGTYTHDEQAVQRPEVGVQESFRDRRKPRTYRYDSSLSPELCWDENANRPLAEWLIELIAQAAEGGEAAVFQSPQVWEGTGEAFRSTRECAARLRSLTKPFLNWSGKAERQQISVPTIPLFVHERHSTNAIIKGLESYRRAGTNLDLFGDPRLDIADKLDAYEHKGPWTNRLILGDSLQVMNSLLEYEGLGGQVQMIYMDPPYGVKFGSNFQPFVRNREVKHGKDEEMIREPEMVKAYRDTWELGLHSYLTYLRDRLLLARELLTESGSIFVQISENNAHHVRELLDEVFGVGNFFSDIVFIKAGALGSSGLPRRNDYLLWYAKDASKVKYHPLFTKKDFWEETETYSKVQESDGAIRSITLEERQGGPLPEGSKVFRYVVLTKPGPGQKYDVEFRGKKFHPGNRWWGFPPESMDALIKSGRVAIQGRNLASLRFIDDFPVAQISNVWTDTATGSGMGKLYVVQTNTKVVERCMQMTTDPGDLVFDPTCGSGTTAYVAEQWGRRWITCDTSRVPLALARQRLLTATFPWYDLKEPDRGPGGGFRYERRKNRKGEEVGGLVPRITLKSIANDEPPETVTLVDRPEANTTVTRVTGPFSVEATVQAARSIEDATGDAENTPALAEAPATYENPRVYLDRMIEVLRQSQTLRLPGNRSLSFAQVRPLDAESHEYLHAEAIEKNGEDKRVAVVFGPEEGAISSDVVFNAASEAHFLRFDALYFFGFAIQAKARSLIEDRKKLRLPCFYVSVTPDVVMSDLLKTSKSSEVFSVTGLPDVRVEPTGEKTSNGDPLYTVELLGLDIFRPHDLETEAIAAENLPCWMLDTDYDGMVFIARQVFFPKTSAWDNLQKALKGRFDESVWEHLAGTVSEPFVLDEHQRIAVKVIDERGNELMVVKALGA